MIAQTEVLIFNLFINPFLNFTHHIHTNITHQIHTNNNNNILLIKFIPVLLFMFIQRVHKGRKKSNLLNNNTLKNIKTFSLGHYSKVKHMVLFEGLR